LITRADYLFDLDADQVPGRREALPRPLHLAGCGVHAPPLAKVARIVELEIGSGVLERGVQVASAPGIEGGPHDLDILLRHPPVQYLAESAALTAEALEPAVSACTGHPTSRISGADRWSEDQPNN
jgi:hypothetical protein